MADVATARILAEFFHCSVFKLGHLPNRWIEDALLLMEMEARQQQLRDGQSLGKSSKHPPDEATEYGLSMEALGG